jgi:hypothetical protein
MKRYLDIIKKHYEKVILSVVLLGLALAAGYLPIRISNDRAELQQQSDEIRNRPAKPLDALDTNLLAKALAETRERFEVSLAAPPHNTVNPVDWHREKPGMPLERSAKRPTGASRVEVTKVTPLYRSLSWVNTGGGGTNYLLRFEDQSLPPGSRRTQQSYVVVGQKLGPAVLKQARTGAGRAPELVVEFTESKETVTLGTNQPFRQIAGYTADLKYEPENRPWRDQRVGAVLKVANQDYTLSAINLVADGRYEVVLSAKQTGKKTTLPFNAASQP